VQGPLETAGATPSVLPFPEEFGMGWGVDLVWAASRSAAVGWE
jgi:hypothetical protein